MNHKVIIGLRSRTVGGVDVFSINLAHGLARMGIPVRILITRHYDPDPYSWPFPEDLHIDQLPVHRRDTWRNRWRAMIKYLEEQAPCIYIPNNDIEYSCVSPKLSDKVMIVGIIHSDEYFHYEHVMRLGDYWNGIVAVSEAIASQTRLLNEGLAKRLVTIPCGVTIPETYCPRNFTTEAPLRIIYAGRLVQEQKRVLDLRTILSKLVDARIPVELTIVGDGEQRMELEQACANFISTGIMRILGIFPNVEVLKFFESQDVVLLTSDFEGMPVCLLEAMGRGCIPVVNDIRSGIPELIRDDWNGYIFKYDDLDGLTRKIACLRQDLQKRHTMSLNAYETIQKNYQLGSTVESYMRLFDRIREESESGLYKRQPGPILYPTRLGITWKDQLPTSVRNAGAFGKETFREMKNLFVEKLSYARNSFLI